MSEIVTTGSSSRRRDWYAIVAFWLAFLIMIAPTQADLLAMLVPQKRFDLAALVALSCFAIVAIPYRRSLLRHLREPQIWSGRGYLIAMSVILILDVVFMGVIVVLALADKV